jgi:hypothetical protein
MSADLSYKEQLLQKIASKSATVGVIGLGHKPDIGDDREFQNPAPYGKARLVVDTRDLLPKRRDRPTLVRA